MTSVLFVTKPLDAVIVTRVVVLVADVRAWTVVVQAPPGTTIVGGAAIKELLDDSNTSWPPEGAGPDRVTRIVIDRPPVTLPDAVKRSIDENAETGAVEIGPRMYEASTNATINWIQL